MRSTRRGAECEATRPVQCELLTCSKPHTEYLHVCVYTAASHLKSFEDIEVRKLSEHNYYHLLFTIRPKYGTPYSVIVCGRFTFNTIEYIEYRIGKQQLRILYYSARRKSQTATDDASLNTARIQHMPVNPRVIMPPDNCPEVGLT